MARRLISYIHRCRMSIIVERQMAPGLFVAHTQSIRGDEGHAMWTLRKLRKSQKCVVTGKPLTKGEFHYGPIGNMDYRGWRVHRSFFEDDAPCSKCRASGGVDHCVCPAPQSNPEGRS